MTTGGGTRRTRVLMIVQDTHIDRRIVQEARSLAAAGYDVRVLGRAPGAVDVHEELDGIPVERVAIVGRDPRYRWLYRLLGRERGSWLVARWGVLTRRPSFRLVALPYAIAADADVYHAHDLSNLELASRAADERGARLVYDAHELFPEIRARAIRIRRRAWRRVEHALLPRADLTITVNELIADELARRHDVARPLVLHNCPDPPTAFDPRCRYDLTRARLGLPSTTKVVLYQGGFAASRGLENLIRSACHLRGDAVVVLLGRGELQRKLEDLAARVGGGRVHFLEAVPQEELLAYTASADVAVIPYAAVDLNTYYCSPNKLYDYIQAAVPIVANDLPYLRRIVAENDIGVVADLGTPERLAAAVDSILGAPADAARFRENLLRIGPAYSWREEEPRLLAAYAQLTGGA